MNLNSPHDLVVEFVDVTRMLKASLPRLEPDRAFRARLGSELAATAVERRPNVTVLKLEPAWNDPERLLPVVAVGSGLGLLTWLLRSRRVPVSRPADHHRAQAV